LPYKNKIMKKIVLSTMLGALVFLSSCKKDEVVFADTTVSAPAAVTEVTAGNAGKVSFSVTTDPNVTATYSAVGTNVTVSNATGSISGSTLELNFTTSKDGVGSIALTVTDSKGRIANATAVIQVGKVITEVVVTSNITTNTTWDAKKVWILGGRITVTSGATLTIEPGTIIKGEAGAGASATALIVARGGKLNAAGTATKPIIFTAVADKLSIADVAAGKFASPNLPPSVNGLWGGLIILGKAKISASVKETTTQKTEVQIEGIPTSDPNGLYGGDDDADNSGVYKYISVRHGGTEIGAGNEINGITLGGVGSGTVFENIEVVGNQDDGIEWFGGTVNGKNIVVWNAGDDGLDTDQAFRGTITNFAIISAAGSSFELDGPEGTYGLDLSGHTFDKGFVNVSGSAGNFIDNDDDVAVTLKNIYATGFSATAFTQNITEVFTSPYKTKAGITFENIVMNVVPADLAKYIDKSTGKTIPSTITAGNSITGGADLTAFAGWSWTAIADKLK
jgi:hypothetical protein